MRELLHDSLWYKTYRVRTLIRLESTSHILKSARTIKITKKHKIKKLLKLWKMRHLPIKDSIFIFKTLAMSNIMHRKVEEKEVPSICNGMHLYNSYLEGESWHDEG